MNTEHRNINDIVPYGEFIRGFANQSFLTKAELQRILKTRGIFFPFQDKDVMVPVLQTLLLNPKEFDSIKECFNTKEDKEKRISRSIEWANNNQNLLQQGILECQLDDFVAKNLPTCKLTRPVKLHSVDNNPNHLKAEFELERNDLNKSWYEQKNNFKASFEFIKMEDGKGEVKITHTAPETKILAEYAVKIKKEQFEQKQMIVETNAMKSILFKDFSNEDRIVFLFRLSTNLQNSNVFEFIEIGDVSLKPENETELPEKISWMNRIKKLLMSGKNLNETFFIKEKDYHKHIVIWSIDAKFNYTFKGAQGECIFTFGFPDFNSKQKTDSEFELNLSLPNPKNKIDTREKKLLESKLLEEMDKQKMIVYNKFIEYKNKKE